MLHWTKEKIKLESKTSTLPLSFAKDIHKESKGHLHPLLPFFVINSSTFGFQSLNTLTVRVFKLVSKVLWHLFNQTILTCLKKVLCFILYSTNWSKSYLKMTLHLKTGIKAGSALAASKDYKLGPRGTALLSPMNGTTCYSLDSSATLLLDYTLKYWTSNSGNCH